MKKVLGAAGSENTAVTTTTDDIVDSPEKNKEDSPVKTDELSAQKKVEEAKQGDLIVAEEIGEGKVEWSDYMKLLSFSYGGWGAFAYIFVAMICGFTQLFTSWYLTHWTSLPLKEQ